MVTKLPNAHTRRQWSFDHPLLTATVVTLLAIIVCGLYAIAKHAFQWLPFLAFSSLSLIIAVPAGCGIIKRNRRRRQNATPPD